LAGGGEGSIGCRLCASIAVRSDACNDDDGNNRGNPNRAGAGGRLSIRIGGGGSIWIAVEAGVRHIWFLSGLLLSGQRGIPKPVPCDGAQSGTAGAVCGQCASFRGLRCGSRSRYPLRVRGPVMAFPRAWPRLPKGPAGPFSFGNRSWSRECGARHQGEISGPFAHGFPRVRIS
jgi:hypothetical protein